MEKKNEIYYIYKRTNLLNGKIYIGQTKQDPKKRWNDEDNSNQKIGIAVREQGKENFKNEIIEIHHSLEKTLEREQYWIAYYNSNNPNKGYNGNKGGGGGNSTSKKQYVWLNKKLFFNFQKDIIKYNPALSTYLERPFYRNFKNKNSPIWSLMTLQDYYKLIKEGIINKDDYNLDEFTVYK